MPTVSALHLRAKVLLSQNRIDEAHAVLLQARAEAEAMQTRYRLVPVLISLSQVEAQRNNAGAAQSLRAEARQVVEYIAAHSPPDIRASFLNRRDVAEVMGE